MGAFVSSSSQPKPNGLASFSPGLPKATLENKRTVFKPQRGFAQQFESLRRNPVGVGIPTNIHRVARSAQPYAGGRNAVGVEIQLNVSF